MQERGTALKTLVSTRPGCRYSRGTRLDSLSPSEKGKTRVSYFNFEFTSRMATSLVQSVNQRGSHPGSELKIEVTHSRLPLLRWAQRVQTCPSRIAATGPSTDQRLQGGTALLHRSEEHTAELQ